MKPLWKEAAKDKEGDEDDGGKKDKSASTLESLFEPTPFSSLAFNGKVRNLIAAGDANGVVHVWRLPQDLVSPSQGDVTQFNTTFESISIE